MEILGVITARGNSRRVPRKNVRLLCGKPLIVYTIEAAQKSKLLSRLILSSDDDEITEIAKSYGVEVPFMRPGSLARDDTPHIDVMIHAVGLMEAQGYKPDIIVILQPTSPLRIAQDIDNGLQLHIETNADSMVAIDPTTCQPNGAFFSVKRDILMNKYSLYGAQIRRYFMPPARSVDINTQHDFELATLLIRNNAT